jgi:hypothetical protein
MPDNVPSGVGVPAEARGCFTRLTVTRHSGLLHSVVVYAEPQQIPHASPASTINGSAIRRMTLRTAADAGLRRRDPRAAVVRRHEIARAITVSRSLHRTSERTETNAWECLVIPISDPRAARLSAVGDRRRQVVSRRGSDAPLRYDAVRDDDLRGAPAGVPVNVIKERAGQAQVDRDDAADRGAPFARSRSSTGQ